MRTRFYLVRHAEAQTNLDPFFKGETNSLTEKGSQQARDVAQRLRALPIKRLFTSPARRAQATAAEIALVFGLGPTVHQDLDERAVRPTSEKTYEPIETLEAFTRRVASMRLELEKQTDRHIVIVSHAIFLRIFAASLLIGDEASEEQVSHVSKTLLLDHATVSKLTFDHEKRRWQIEYWNNAGEIREEDEAQKKPL